MTHQAPSSDRIHYQLTNQVSAMISAGRSSAEIMAGLNVSLAQVELIRSGWAERKRQLTAYSERLAYRRKHPHPCYCPAYAFPHRFGGGKCSGSTTICSDCGADCNEKSVDFGIGAYEAYGRSGIDRQIATVSDCCENQIFYYPEYHPR